MLEVGVSMIEISCREFFKMHKLKMNENHQSIRTMFGRMNREAIEPVILDNKNRRTKDERTSPDGPT
jgi:hypothetical protein